MHIIDLKRYITKEENKPSLLIYGNMMYSSPTHPVHDQDLEFYYKKQNMFSLSIFRNIEIMHMVEI